VQLRNLVLKADFLAQNNLSISQQKLSRLKSDSVKNVSAAPLVV
jgi:hypothetical protein